jgi:hypothetical protein
MRRSTVFFVATLAATVFFGACGGPQRVEVGELQTETRSVEPENAESVRASLKMAWAR